jgi:arylsulfatase A
VNANTSIETGADPEPQLYDLETDPGETGNLARDRPQLVRDLSELLDSVKRGNDGRLAP